MSERLQLFLMFFPVFLFSLSFHESAHAWMAHKKGDDTARLLGRLTLNPIPHMDLLGTVLLPIFLFFSSVALPIGGWGKPVPVDYRNLKDGRHGAFWVALAGPASNLILATAFSLLLRLMALVRFDLGFLNPLYSVFEIGVYLNLGLAFFNLIPLHPLDGGKVMEGLLPLKYVDAFNRVAQYGMLIIFAGFYLGLFEVIRVPIRFFARILIP